MKSTYNYIYLNPQDKKKLTNQAKAKQLSVSTYTSIIVNNYGFLTKMENPNTEKKFINSYINKGSCRIHLKFRTSKPWNYNDQEITNSIYLYLHQELINKYIELPKTKLTSMNRTIQSTADKTIDARWNYNEQIRLAYLTSKLMESKKCH